MSALQEDMAQKLPTGTVTFLMTDVEGSTRLWEKHTDSMKYVMSRHDHLLADAIVSCNGVHLKERGEGDSHFGVFTRASDAVVCALKLLAAMRDEPWPEVGELRVRVALHSGEADLRGNDYYGPAVNRCARMRAAAHGAQVVLSDATRQLLGSALPDGARLKDLGTHRLKDLQHADKIYQLCAEGLPDEFPPLKSMSAAKNNLPIQLTSFIGREDELEAIKKLVFSHRLVTLIGAGGSGKTRLSIQVAAEVVDDIPDGVWFIPLVSLRDGKLIAHRMLESLPISAEGRDSLDAVIDEYKDCRALFVFDNCEHLIKEVAPIVNRLLHECPNLIVMASSREALAVKGENIYPVPTMECDLRGEEASLERVSDLEAVKLFCDRGANRTQDAILDDDSAEVVAALCKRLDGIPLAIEQAASHLSYLSPKQILARIEKHFAVLEWDEEGVDDRHKTIQATIDWSYRMLEEDERMLFARLSVFAGGWSLEAAEHVCADFALATKRVLPLMRGLIERSLVQTEKAAWGDQHYRMLEPIREFAAEKRERSDEEELRARHFEWHSHLAQQAYNVGLDAQDGRYMKWLMAEHDNIRSALGWALARDDKGVEALEMCVAMHRFWIRHADIPEGMTWLQRALDKATSASKELTANGLNVLGALMFYLGKYDAAEKPFKRSLELFRELGNEEKIGALTCNIGLIMFQQDMYGDAKPMLQEAVVLLERYGKSVQAAEAHENLAVTEEMLGFVEESVKHFETCVSLLRGSDEIAKLCHALQNLLGSYAGLGRLLDNKNLVEETARLTNERGDSFSTFGMLEVACQFALEMGDGEFAAELLAASNKVRETSGMSAQSFNTKFRDRLEGEIRKVVDDATLRRAYKSGRAQAARMLGTFVERYFPD